MKKDDGQLFKSLVEKSDLEMPFSNFEDEVMIQIKKQAIAQKAPSKNLAFSWIFFVAGTIFGIIISLFLPNMTDSIGGINTDNILIVFQVVFVLVVLLQLESLLTSTRKRLRTRHGKPNY